MERLGEYIESLNEYIADCEREIPRKNLYCEYEEEGVKERLTD